jgi:hypothetical protein
MAFQLSPGVNVSEIDLTNVVPAVSFRNLRKFFEVRFISKRGIRKYPNTK